MKECVHITEKTKKMYDSFSKTLKSVKAREQYWNFLCTMCDIADRDLSLFDKNDFKKISDYYNDRADNGILLYSTVYSKLSMASSICEFAAINRTVFGYPDDFENYFRESEHPMFNGIYRTEKSVPLNDLDRLLSAADDFQMYVAIALVAKCGLKTSEVCNLKVSNLVVDANNRLGIVFLRQPANKYIRLTQDVAELIIRLLDIRNSDSEFVFLNSSGNPMSIRSIQQRFKKIADKAFPGRNITMKDLRNTSAVRLLKAGASEAAVAQYLGISTNWIRRYDRAIDQFDDSPVEGLEFNITKKEHSGKLEFRSYDAPPSGDEKDGEHIE